VAGVKRTVAVDLGAGLVLPTPVLVASGCVGTGRELGAFTDLRKVGGVVSRTVTLEPRKGTPTPRVAESAAGIVWSTGLQNPGVDVFVRDELPRLARGTTVIVSIGGGSLEEYVRLTGQLQGRPEVAALETYLAGPDEELGRDSIGAHVDRAAEIVGAVARMSLVPTFAKLSLDSPDVVTVAEAVVRAGPRRGHGLAVGPRRQADHAPRGVRRRARRAGRADPRERRRAHGR
jgi:dihydroorotate dehydrogenase (NAD+) catalytic subunit